jgi:hypothetical protein
MVKELRDKQGAILVLLVVVFTTQAMGQVNPKLRPGDRPVFMSASRLAVLCEDWGALHPGGLPPKDSDTLNVSEREIVRSNACESYIFGVLDAGLEEKIGSRYHPVPSAVDYMKTLIDSFLKYVQEHPEEQDFAASTALNKVQRLIVEAQTPETKR